MKKKKAWRQGKAWWQRENYGRMRGQVSNKKVRHSLELLKESSWLFTPWLRENWDPGKSHEKREWLLPKKLLPTQIICSSAFLGIVSKKQSWCYKSFISMALAYTNLIYKNIHGTH